MTIQYDAAIFDKLKAVDVRIRTSFHEKMDLFRRDPYNSYLNNHELRDEYAGCRSINITNDYQAIYEEVSAGDEPIAYFFLLGTHKELYG
jgi:mRNA-degrading endonuclease YafQ of YafQ-DinJ toxin-antitoxin module